MDQVKTYSKVNRNNPSLTFGISKIETIFEQRKGVPDLPHRHDYYTVILTRKANGKHFIDFQEYELSGNQLYFIAPGQVHQIIENEQSFGYVIVFSVDFLAKNNIPIDFIENLRLFNIFEKNPPLHLNEHELSNLHRYFEEIFQIFHHTEMEYKDEALGALLKLMLISCNNICSLPKREKNNKNSILSNFKILINEFFKKWHSTTEYANELSISSDYLNRIVKAQTGKTAKEHIQSRIIVEAKRLLYFTEMTTKEIGFELGFSEPANFSSFFKSHVGVSPSKFIESKK